MKAPWKLLQMMCTVSRQLDTRLTHKSVTLLGTNDKLTEKEIRKTAHLKIASNNTKYIRL